MLGAIVGDIVGSRFEFANTHRTDFEFFADGCNYTDDTICTIAIADALLRGADFADTLQTWCRRYPHPKGAYGGRFHQWIYTTPTSSVPQLWQWQCYACLTVWLALHSRYRPVAS